MANKSIKIIFLILSVTSIVLLITYAPDVHQSGWRPVSGFTITITGDIEQIDNIYVNETSNGLAHAVEKFKEFPIAGHVTFKKGERSEVATMAAKVL